MSMPQSARNGERPVWLVCRGGGRNKDGAKGESWKTLSYDGKPFEDRREEHDSFRHKEKGVVLAAANQAFDFRSAKFETLLGIHVEM